MRSKFYSNTQLPHIDKNEVILFLKKYSSKEEIKCALNYFEAAEKAFMYFHDCSFNSPSFFHVTETLLSAIDQWRLFFEKVIMNKISLSEDASQLRKRFLEKFVSPYFNVLSSFENQKKIIEGILVNLSWLEEIRNRTVDHPIGFLKIPIISFGGNSYKLDSGDNADKLQDYNRPSIELRFHLYNSGSQLIHEEIHSHGFDLLSKVGNTGVFIDQKFELIERKANKKLRKKMDYLGVDINHFYSEAKKEPTIKNKLDLEQSIETNIFNPSETYRFYRNSKNNYQMLLFSQPYHQFYLIHHKCHVVERGSCRLHLSEYPHYALISPNFSHTFCLTLRRSGGVGKGKFKPSFLLSEEENNGLSPGLGVQDPPNLLDINDLKQTLSDFLKTLDSEMTLTHTLGTESNDIAKLYNLGNLLNTLIAFKEPGSKKDTIEFLIYLFNKEIDLPPFPFRRFHVFVHFGQFTGWNGQ